MLVEEESTIAPVEVSPCLRMFCHIRERKDGCFCTFNDFNTFTQLSFPSLPQISTFFSHHAFPKRPFSSSASFPARKAAIIFCCQLRVIMRSTGCAVQYWGITLKWFRKITISYCRSIFYNILTYIFIIALLHVKYFKRTMLKNLEGDWNVQIKLTVANNFISRSWLPTR